MSESSYFAVACAIALMQAVESATLLARNGRINGVMMLSSAVEFAWLVVTIIALRADWLSDGRAVWAWVFIIYYSAYSWAGIRCMSNTDQEDGDPSDLRELFDQMRIPAALAVPSIAFSVVYGIGLFLQLRAL